MSYRRIVELSGYCPERVALEATSDRFPRMNTRFDGHRAVDVRAVAEQAAEFHVRIDGVMTTSV